MPAIRWRLSKVPIGLSVDCAGGAITAIRIAGSALPVMAGHITPPDA